MRSLLIIFFAMVSTGFAAPPKDLVKAQLLADVKSIKPGSTFRIGVDLTIEPGWHIYWINPGEGGLPTKAVLNLPKGLKADDVQFPIPKTFDMPGGLTAYGYEDHAMLLATIHVEDDYKATGTKIGCDAIWLVCKDICVAGKASPTLNLSLGKAESDRIDQFSKAIAALPKAATEIKGGRQIGSDVFVSDNRTWGTLAISIPASMRGVGDIQFFPPQIEGVTFKKPAVTIATTLPADTWQLAKVQTDFEVLAGQKLPNQAVDSVLSFRQNDQTVGVKVPMHFESAHTGLQLPAD